MKMTKTIMSVAISMVCAGATMAYADGLPPAVAARIAAQSGSAPATTTPAPVVATTAPVTVNVAQSPTAVVLPNQAAVPVGASQADTAVAQPPSDGNSYEKLVTPLLRQISQRKAQLELKKLDREIEKMDEDSVKDQIELKAAQDKANNPSASKNDGFTPVYPPGQSPMSNANNQQQLASLLKASSASSVRVLMTYGYANDLYAKISTGDEGGFVVKKGDVLPDGRLVTDVEPNYIAVKTAKTKAAKGTEKIFVTGEPATAANGAGGSTTSYGASSLPPLPAGSVTPSLAPLPSNGAISALIPLKK
jgi:hypothetical protein